MLNCLFSALTVAVVGLWLSASMTQLPQCTNYLAINAFVSLIFFCDYKYLPPASIEKSTALMVVEHFTDMIVWRNPYASMITDVPALIETNANAPAIARLLTIDDGSRSNTFGGWHWLMNVIGSAISLVAPKVPAPVVRFYKKNLAIVTSFGQKMRKLVSWGVICILCYLTQNHWLVNDLPVAAKESRAADLFADSTASLLRNSVIESPPLDEFDRALANVSIDSDLSYLSAQCVYDMVCCQWTSENVLVGAAATAGSTESDSTTTDSADSAVTDPADSVTNATDLAASAANAIADSAKPVTVDPVDSAAADSVDSATDDSATDDSATADSATADSVESVTADFVDSVTADLADPADSTATDSADHADSTATATAELTSTAIMATTASDDESVSSTIEPETNEPRHPLETLSPAAQRSSELVASTPEDTTEVSVPDNSELFAKAEVEITELEKWSPLNAKTTKEEYTSKAYRLGLDFKTLIEEYTAICAIFASCWGTLAEKRENGVTFEMWDAFKVAARTHDIVKVFESLVDGTKSRDPWYVKRAVDTVRLVVNALNPEICSPETISPKFSGITVTQRPFRFWGERINSPNEFLVQLTQTYFGSSGQDMETLFLNDFHRIEQIATTEAYQPNRQDTRFCKKLAGEWEKRSKNIGAFHKKLCREVRHLQSVLLGFNFTYDEHRRQKFPTFRSLDTNVPQTRDEMMQWISTHDVNNMLLELYQESVLKSS